MTQITSNPLQAILADVALQKAAIGIQTTAVATAQFYTVLVANGMPQAPATAVTQTWLTALMLANRTPETKNEKTFSDNEGE